MNKALNFLARLLCAGIVAVGAVSVAVGGWSTDRSLVDGFVSTYPHAKPYAAWIALHHMQLIIGGAIAIALAFAVGYSLMRLLGKPSSHGSARWASVLEVWQAGLAPHRGPRFVLGHRGLQILALSEKLQREHALIVAPNGQFKTSGFIIPNLLEERGLRGLVIHDVKGELLKVCAGALSHYLPVVVWAPARMEISIHYNPLKFVLTEEDAADLAQCWIDNTGISRETFWNDTARLLVQAIILHLVDCEPGAPFSRLGDLLGTATFDQIRKVLEHSKSQRAREIGASFVGNVANDARLAAGIMSGMAARFLALRNKAIRELTSTHPDPEKNLDLHKLASTPQALFVVIAATDAKRLKPITAALLMQLMNHLTRNPLERGMAFYLDELCNAGNIPHYTEHISLVRGQNLALLQVIQDFGQLRREYGPDGAQTILTNSNTKVFLPGVGKQESEFASELVGDMTIRTVSYSHRRGYDGRENVSYTRRRMMHPDEIRRMKRGSVLVISSNVAPILARFVPYFKRKKYMRLVDLPIVESGTPQPPAPPAPPAGPLPVTPVSPAPAPAAPVVLPPILPVPPTPSLP